MLWPAADKDVVQMHLNKAEPHLGPTRSAGAYMQPVTPF